MKGISILKMGICALAAMMLSLTTVPAAEAATTVRVTNISPVGPSRNMSISYGGFNGVVQAVAQRLTLDDGTFYNVFCIEPNSLALSGAVDLMFEVGELSAYAGLTNPNAIAAFARYGLSTIGARSPVGQFGVTFYGNGAGANLGHASTAALLADTNAAFSTFAAADFRLEGVQYLRAVGGAGQDYVMLAAVPEPSTWAMLIVGFGVIGASARRARRTKPAAAIA